MLAEEGNMDKFHDRAFKVARQTPAGSGIPRADGTIFQSMLAKSYRRQNGERWGRPRHSLAPFDNQAPLISPRYAS